MVPCFASYSSTSLAPASATYSLPCCQASPLQQGLFPGVMLGPQLAAQEVHLPAFRQGIGAELLFRAQVDEHPLAVGGQVVTRRCDSPIAFSR